MRTVFGAGDDHRMFQPDVLHWKCLAPHPFWEGSRGYALRYKGEIAAFGCAVPYRFLSGPGTVAGCNVIDWAASKAVPGAGLMLYRHIQTLAGTMINIGGTADARRVLPANGFEVRAELHHFTRVLRPLRHMRHAPARDWKSPLRLARDYRELARATPTARPARASQPITAFPDPAATHQVVCARTPESLAYVIACPAAKIESYVFNGGYFLLSRIGHQCRIADLWVASPRAQDWAAAYAAAAAAADTAAITAGASQPLQIAALRQAGYRETHSEPVFVLDPDHQLGGRRDLALSLLENDAFYWSATQTR
ncbi:MAG TPA: hypothetical protein VMT86_20105 [Bryobacteraceae bacterium]|nr:hypothetical protein [Bryobacteraceae bacterium]